MNINGYKELQLLRDPTSNPLYMATPGNPLPSEIVKEIFNRLATVEICNFRSTSTGWKQFIKKDPNLSKRLVVVSLLAQAKPIALTIRHSRDQALALLKIVKIEA